MKLVFILSALVLFSACGKSQNSSGGSSTDRYVDPIVDSQGSLRELTVLINDHRRRMRLPALTRIRVLDVESQMHALNMAQGRVPFGHWGMSERCLRARREVPRANQCGEVVARFQVHAEAALTSWLSSWSHRRQLEDRRYRALGLGMALDREGRPYWVAMLLER